MLENILKKINNDVHIRDSVNIYMNYFIEKYNINNCVIVNNKNNTRLYHKGEDYQDDKNYKNKILLNDNSYEKIIFYLDKKLPKNKKSCSIDIEILKLTLTNYILYKDILSISKSRLMKKKEVETLMEISRELIFLRDQDNIFNSFIFAVMGQVLISKVAIYLSEDEKNFKLTRKKGFRNLPENLTFERNINKVLDLTKEGVSVDGLDEKEIHLIVPMQYLEKTKGLAILGYKMDNEKIDRSEHNFLFSLATNVIFAVENSKLIQESIEKKRMEQELNLARDIQKNILPQNIPGLKQWDTHGINIPSREVGGDYYYLKQIGNKLCFVIADVTGKSIPAALLVSTLHSAFSILTQDDVDLGDLVEKLNSVIYENTSLEQFITLFIGVIDIKKDRFDYINCGHNYPFILKNNEETERLKEGGRILGIAPEYSYDIGSKNTEDIKLITMYTDGITEATNNYGDEFEDKRLEKILFNNRKMSSEKICNTIVSEVNDFKSKNVIHDDMTLLVLKNCKNKI